VPGGHAHSLLTQTRFAPQVCAQKPQLLLSFVRSTQLVPHCARPVAHVAEHAPVLHTWPPRQTVPQAPQLVPLVCVSTQVPLPPKKPPRPATPPHLVSFAGQLQAPSLHVEPEGQTVPQAPQSSALVARSTHTGPHCVCPVGQPAMQAPPTHCSPNRHRTPHAPQSAVSVCSFTHCAPQEDVPVPQTQPPSVQLAPVAHAVPQAPQLFGSVCSFTQAFLQSVKLAAQLVVQTPSEQTWSAAHTNAPPSPAVPHPPQLVGSLCVSVQTPSQRMPLL
jgi:hypothetical protein